MKRRKKRSRTLMYNPAELPGGSVSGCISKMKRKGGIDDPGAYCAAIADKVEPGWREKNPVYLNAYSLPYNYPYSYFYTEPNRSGQYGYMHPGAGYRYPWSGYGGWYPDPGRTLQPYPSRAANPWGITYPGGPQHAAARYTGQYNYPPQAYQGVKFNPDMKVEVYGPERQRSRQRNPYFQAYGRPWYPSAGGRWPYPTFYPAYYARWSYWPWWLWRWHLYNFHRPTMPVSGRFPTLSGPG